MTRIKVDCDLKNLVQKLSDPALPDAQKGSLILGLHEKFWHAPAHRIMQLLERAGVPKETLALVPLCIPQLCKRCMQFAHAKHRPKVKSRLATKFNQVVQADLFFLWERVLIIIVDECTRYKFAAELTSKSYEAILECLQLGWFHYFGPPKIFICDQEGALAGDAFAHVCDKYRIDRWLAGSDPQNLGRGGRHTTTGLAENISICSSFRCLRCMPIASSRVSFVRRQKLVPSA